MAQTRSLDANCILRLVLQDLPEQVTKVEVLLQTDDSFHIADMALAEVVFVLEKQYHLTRELIVQQLAYLTSFGQINCNRELIRRVSGSYVQFPSLSFIDCCLAVYAELNNATPLMTFDKALAKHLPKLAQEVA